MMKSSPFDVAFFAQHLRDKGTMMETSIARYSEGVERFLKTDPDLEKLEDYNNFLIEVAVKKRMTNFYSFIKAYIEFKISDGNLRTKLLDGLIKPPLRHDVKIERKYLPEEKIIDIINSMKSERHKMIALIQTLTGVRVGDVLRIARGNIFSEEYKGAVALRLVILGKGRKRNVVYIHDQIAIGILLNWIQNNYLNDKYYFMVTESESWKSPLTDSVKMFRYNYDQYWRDLKAALHSCGFSTKDFASHDMRRCFARRVWERYKDIHVLQSMLNHSDPKVTLKYLEQSGLKNVDYHYDMQTR